MRNPHRTHFRVFKYMTSWYVYWCSPLSPSRLCGTFLAGDSALLYVQLMNDAGA